MEALGVDIGGVIIDRVDDNADTSFFGDNYLATPAVPGVVEALARLVTGKFGDQVYLVSKCGQRTQDRSLAWLAHHDFYTRTGIRPGHARFCRQRPGKAAIATELGLTHFVDDRLEVLGYLDTVPNLYLFRPQDREVRRHRHHLHRVYTARTWSEITQAVLAP
jgi:hypothetical protein